MQGAAYYQTYSFLNEKSFDKVAKCTNLAFGRREKNMRVQKVPRGQEAYKKNRKKSGDLFFFFWRLKNLWGAAKNEQGAPNGNVTPLPRGHVIYRPRGCMDIYIYLVIYIYALDKEPIVLNVKLNKGSYKYSTETI